VGHVQSPRAFARGQPPGIALGVPRWHPGCRRCLLKGCERWFLPKRPQARYCSAPCQHAARRWRRWHASQRYRTTTHGKERRRDQARRYRRRGQQRSTSPEPASPTSQLELQPPGVEPEPPSTTDPPITSSPAGEGQRPDEILEKSCGLPCDRPGCYVLFLPTPRSPQQHFCSGHCRQALRRVRQREDRQSQRRQRGGRPQRRDQRGPPSATPLMSSRIETATS
jgi:hypothetical protein